MGTLHKDIAIKLVSNGGAFVKPQNSETLLTLSSGSIENTGTGNAKLIGVSQKLNKKMSDSLAILPDFA